MFTEVTELLDSIVKALMCVSVSVSMMECGFSFRTSREREWICSLSFLPKVIGSNAQNAINLCIERI